MSERQTDRQTERKTNWQRDRYRQRSKVLVGFHCRYHGGRRPSSDDSFHSPTVIPPSALDKPSIMKRYHPRRTTMWSMTARSPTMVTLHDTGFVECRWWNDGWSVKTVVTWRSSASMIPAPDDWRQKAPERNAVACLMTLLPSKTRCMDKVNLKQR